MGEERCDFANLRGRAEIRIRVVGKSRLLTSRVLAGILVKGIDSGCIRGGRLQRSTRVHGRVLVGRCSAGSRRRNFEREFVERRTRDEANCGKGSEGRWRGEVRWVGFHGKLERGRDREGGGKS